MILLSSRKRRARDAAERIYAAAVTAARRPELYAIHGVPDTLQGRFEMMALHLFPVVHRLMRDPGDDPELARLVAERFVADMDDAFREMGVGDVSMPKRIKALYRSFAGRIEAYKSGLEAGEDGLRAAVARNIFPDGADDRHVLSLAALLGSAVEALRRVRLEAVRGGNLPFPDPFPHRSRGNEAMSAEPFSYLVPAHEIPSSGKRYHVEADAEARRRLAEALEIPEIAAIIAELEAKPLGGGVIAVRGALSASVVQTDVVTLDPTAQEVNEQIDVTLARAEDVGRDMHEKDMPGGGAGGEDTYSDGLIDLGAVIREHLALGLDPHPKARGTNFAGYVEDDAADDPSPFAVLAKLKQRGGSAP